MKKKSLSYILNHLGEDREKYFNAVSPPVIQTSNFAFDSFSAFKDAISNEMQSHIYTRGNNPTVEILRKKVAALEETEDCLAFSSGSAAMASAILTNLKSGDHLICVENPYSWTKILIKEILPQYDITYDFVDGTNINNIEAAITPKTKMLMLESPNSATFALQDLHKCSELAKKHGILTAIDNSYCSPIFQQPHKMGIDLVLHSGTKYINGHSDVVCGFICGSKDHIKKIFHFATMTLGIIISPHDASLIIRGLRTLPLRMKRSHDSCVKIVDFLKSHHEVESVLYPWDADFAQHDLAKTQMSGAGGLFSIRLKTKSISKIEVFVQALEGFLFAVSWGGHESLVLPYCSLMNADGHESTDEKVNLVRFYIGLEDPDELIQDIDQALSTIN